MGQIAKSLYDVAMYWKDYWITEKGEVVPRGTKNGEMVICDLGEPCCWACNKQIDVDSHECTDRHVDIDFKRLWAKVGGDLERCHIVPKSLGGSDDVSNAFLLCPKCHEESPDTANPSSFIRWVYRKRKNTMLGGINLPTLIKELDEELTQRGLPKSSEIFKLTHLNDKKADEIERELTDYCEGKYSFHYGKGLVHSSIVCVVCDWIEEKYRSACHQSDVVV